MCLFIYTITNKLLLFQYICPSINRNNCNTTYSSFLNADVSNLSNVFLIVLCHTSATTHSFQLYIYTCIPFCTSHTSVTTHSFQLYIYTCIPFCTSHTSATTHSFQLYIYTCKVKMLNIYLKRYHSMFRVQ